MEFRLLGLVEASTGGVPVDLGRRRQRGLLALLLLEPGRPMSVERLIELLFADGAAREPRKAVQVDVSRLRRTLAAAASADEVRVVSDSAGYAIQVDPATVDVHRFGQLIDQARRTQAAAERVELLRAALDLWRGPALADLGDSAFVGPIRARLDQQRLTAIELRVDADLELGRHHELIAELADLATQHPASERLLAARMVALYRAGRKRDSLEVYQHAAGQLADELGLDPSPELRELHTALLRDDPELSAPPIREASAPAPARPAQLPADLPGFTGRDDELASLLARCRLPHETVVVIAIDGMAGVGKTALAIHAARRLSSDYPDGQLFLDLNGYTHGVDPVAVGDALDRLLRALGVPDSQLPHDTDARAALYRSVLADKRVLILLDNAASEAQVEPLLPASPGCLALVTSRGRLAGLDQAIPMSLNVLPQPDAMAVFTHVVGEGRMADEPPRLVEQVVDLCGRLPLAVRIAAARMRTRDAWTLPHLIDRLRDEQHRLAELDVGRRDVSSAFHLSYQQLSDDQRHIFRSLALHVGDDIDTFAAAALAGCSVHEAERALDGLLDVHLLQQHQPSRYRFHDLLRTYAAERAEAEETHADRDAALIRLMDHYTYTASVAMNLLYADEASRRPDVPEPDSATPPLHDRERAGRWLDRESDNLRSAAGYAAANGAHLYTIQLAQLMWRHLNTRGRVVELLHDQALAAARDVGDEVGQVRALVGLGRAHHESGRREIEADNYLAALNLAKRIGDRLGEIDALNGLGRLHRIQGPDDSASDYFRQGLELARSVEDYVGEVVGLTGMAQLHWMRGRLDLAAESFERGLALATEAGDHVGQIDMLNGLARALLDRADYTTSKDLLEQSLRLADEIDIPAGKVQALNGIGQIHLEQGDYESAIACQREVFDIACEVGDRNYQFEGLLGIGHALRAAGEPVHALRSHERALDLARDLDQQYDVGAAHEGVADALHDLGRTDEAREHRQEALAIFTDLEVPDADRVRASLTAADQNTPA